MVADAAEGTGLNLPTIPEAQARHLSEVLGPLVVISNPFDYHTFIWGDRPKMAEVFTTALEGFDAGIYVIDPPRSDTCDTSSYEPAFEAMIAAVQSTGKPAFAVAMLPDTIDAALGARLQAAGVVPLLGLHDALAALEAQA